MPEFKRFAVYFAPPVDSDLAKAGAAILGRDAQTGQAVAHPALGDLPRDLAEITAAPRKYGLHGTLKAPFRLVERADFADLRRGILTLCGDMKPFMMPRFRLTRDWSFLALVPAEESAELAALATACVKRLDGLRAPLNEAEIARRMQSDLNERHRANLARWGYPYVLEDFRFHLTLSGKLAAEEIEPVGNALESYLGDIPDQPMECRELCLFGEAVDGEFRIIERFAFGA